MLLVHELYEVRDRVLLLKSQLEQAKGREIPAFHPFLDEQIRLLQDALEQAEIPERYRVAVVGRFKVGKSAFVNKLIGERLAGVNTSPETAAISIFRYGTEACAEVEFVSEEEWQRLKCDHSDNPENQEVKRYAHFIGFNNRSLGKAQNGNDASRPPADLDALVAQWVTKGGRIHEIKALNWETREGKKSFLNEIKKFTSSREPLHYLVNKLTIYAPIPILRDRIELIDTPGLEDTERFRVQLTEELVKDVDAILFLTSSGSAYSQGDKDFIIHQLRQRQIKHLQLIITKCDTTFDSAIKDASDNGDDPPSFDSFKVSEISRVRTESQQTLNELLQSNELTSDEDGYYFINQLDTVPIHLVSTKYHDEGDIEKGGIEDVRDGLYQILSTSNRFENARNILTDRLEVAIGVLRHHFSERLNTIETASDHAKMQNEIESIRVALEQKIEEFEKNSREALELLEIEQKTVFNKTLNLQLENISLRAKSVLGDLEKADLVKHWKTRRCGYWGTLHSLQTKVADRVFPKVEAILNELNGHLDAYMKSIQTQLSKLQTELAKVEDDHHLPGGEPIELAAMQNPLFDRLRHKFQKLGANERDNIIKKLDDFVNDVVVERLELARKEISGIRGLGTTVKQNDEVARFYHEIRKILVEALKTHLDNRIHEFASAIYKNAKSVCPRIREASEAIIRQRLDAIESSMQVTIEGQKGQTTTYLAQMVSLLRDFAANPDSVAPTAQIPTTSENTDENAKDVSQTAHIRPRAGDDDGILQELHYEIEENATGFTYERIFRPYIDNVSHVWVEDPYIKQPYQVDNFCRFCALAIRCGNLNEIELVSGCHPNENTDDADSRLETLRRDLAGRGVKFTWRRNEALHDREVRFDNGWIIKIGRGLDIYIRPESWISVEAADFSLRHCKQTKVDVYRNAPE
jgi:signal recognition particle receptor subunit beta